MKPAPHRQAQAPLRHAATLRRGPKSDAPKSKPDRQEAIKEVIAGLDLSQPANVTEDGRPDATVLSDILGWHVGAKDRDAAFNDLNKE